MGRCVVAFAPGHISGFFKRVDGNSLSDTGSLGAGIVIGKGVKVSMRPAEKTAISVHGTVTDTAFLTDAVNALGITAEVFAEAELPIGAGFG
ncbi:MAG: GHMP kinase, partial [Methanocorpusculum sp.]|nr:GHMP kinase [Methanocorpusculum sp.]